MSALELRHLAADALPLAPAGRAWLAGSLARAGLPLPRRIEELAPPAEAHEPDARRALARRLEAALAPLGPHVAVLEAIRSLASPGTCCVVTGQQPGFLASPLLSLHKALCALRLARLLSQRWERPVVALFWNHADDHDVAEVHHATVVNANLDLQRFALAGMSSGRKPLSRLVLDEESHRLGALRAQLAQTLHGAPHLEEALELFFPRSGESLARAFTRAFTELLGHLGLVLFEPDWLREECSRALARVIAEDPLPALRRGAAGVRALGLEPPIDPEGAALVYRVDEQGRHALRPGGDGFRYDDEPGSRTPTELAAEIVQDPGAWSPGALARPLVQDLVFPVAAYVGGHGELAYHLELTPWREQVGAPRTPFVPRVSLTLLEPAARAALDKLGLEPAAALRGESAGALGAAEPPPVALELRALAARAAQRLVELRAELSALDPSFAANARRTAEQITSLLEKLAVKAERVHDNRVGKGRRHLRRIASELRPRGELQERVLGPLPFVARHGRAWIDELAGALDPFAPEHVMVLLSPAGDERAEAEEEHA